MFCISLIRHPQIQNISNSHLHLLYYLLLYYFISSNLLIATMRQTNILSSAFVILGAAALPYSSLSSPSLSISRNSTIAADAATYASVSITEPTVSSANFKSAANVNVGSQVSMNASVWGTLAKRFFDTKISEYNQSIANHKTSSQAKERENLQEIKPGTNINELGASKQAATNVPSHNLFEAPDIEDDIPRNAAEAADYIQGQLDPNQIGNSTVEIQRIYGFSWHAPFGDEDIFHYHNEKVDDHCNTFSSVFYPYTGYRVFHQMKFRPVLGFAHSTHLVYCFRGRVVAHASVDNRDNENGLNWQDPLCIYERETFAPDARGCYRIAKRAETPRALPWFRSENFIGGLFRCPSGDPEDECNNENSQPVLPLVGDEPYMGLVDIHSPVRYAMRVPLVYTPDVFGYLYPRETDAWAQYIDINSVYDPEVIAEASAARKSSERYARKAAKKAADNEKKARKERMKSKMKGDPTVGFFTGSHFTGKEIVGVESIDEDYRIKEAYTMLKHALPFDNPFHREFADTPKLKDFMMSYGMKALMFMRNKGQAREIYLNIAKLFDPIEPEPEQGQTFTVDEWRQKVAEYL